MTARKTLSNLNAEDPATRIKAVEEIAGRVQENTEDKELAQTWPDFARERIVSGEKFEVDQAVSEWAATKTREDAQAEGRTISIEPEVDTPIIDQPAPQVRSRKLLVGDAADAGAGASWGGRGNQSVPSRGKSEGSSPAVGNIDDTQAQELQQSQESQSAPLAAPAWAEEQDLDKRWAMAQDEREVAAQDKMLAVEIRCWQSPQAAAKNIIAQVDAKA